MTVYSATTQYRAMGLLVTPTQIRAWIKGDLTSLEQVIQHPIPQSVAELDQIKEWVTASFEMSPWDYAPFLPAVTSVLMVSAPGFLLGSSILSLIVGIGIYLGSIWLGEVGNAAPNGRRAIFITYIVTIGLCMIIYSTSSGELFRQSRLGSPSITKIREHWWMSYYQYVAAQCQNRARSILSPQGQYCSERLSYEVSSTEARHPNRRHLARHTHCFVRARLCSEATPAGWPERNESKIRKRT